MTMRMKFSSVTLRFAFDQLDRADTDPRPLGQLGLRQALNQAMRAQPLAKFDTGFLLGRESKIQHKGLISSSFAKH